ncbi:SIR2 family protein [Pectobacterium carotovorum]|uniref:SIR2 family protein n=1 Tax=Pectobacterium carotovorum TaxID=554 RepID=UPI000582C3FF|nr:SIR2 family protein [Pectobacterium carotovorum]KHS82415.1 hypothetical protein RC84_14835 [Pectobacterium carotovorum subsp. carotovorum]
MKFFADGPSIPDLLLESCDSGRVVFLCGAGVSLPSGMPSFIDLTKYVIDFFQPAEDSEIMTAFQPWLDDPSAANMSLDQIFNLLHQEYGKSEVNELVTERLQLPHASEHIGYEHGLIIRISSNQRGAPQIVTTNFDLLFESSKAAEINFHVPPVFPDLSLGSSLEGVTYLHGRLVPCGIGNHSYVLSSADFGRAYLSEAWATNFVRNLLEYYTVVLVGYQAEDPPVKYLLQGLNHDEKFDRSRLYAFDKGRSADIEAKWRDRGVTAIAYEDHPHLWNTMEAWAERADNPRAWKAKIIETTQLNPKSLAPHQRGQVTHVLRSVQGAKLFSESYPIPHPEWVCVLDGFIRSIKEKRKCTDDAEIFVAYLEYGLDDDLEEITEDDYRRGIRNDNLLEWRQGDDNPPDCHRLGGRQPEGNESISARLLHLLKWIVKSLESPIIAWWAVRQNGLHPRLIDQFDWHLRQNTNIDVKARHIWNLILEHHRDPSNRGYDDSWFDFKYRIDNYGWTVSALREFQRTFQPRLSITLPSGLGRYKPPLQGWSETNIGEIGCFEVKFLERHGDELDVPDEMLDRVITILENIFSTASGMLDDIGISYFTTATCYPDREVDGCDSSEQSPEILILFVKLYDRLAVLNPALANAHAMTWNRSDNYFFCKLKLYALSKTEVFTAATVVNELILLQQEAFWNPDIARELLFLIEDRWPEFSDSDKERLAERIIVGPNQRPYWSDDEYPTIRNEMIVRYSRYLELKGCELSKLHSAMLAKIIPSISQWTDGWAISTVAKYGLHSGWVGTDETPDALINLPINEIVNRVKIDLKRDFASFTEKRPFTGLVKISPRKSLSALTVAAKTGEYPTALWSTLIENMPKEISPRLMRLYLCRLSNLPHSVVADLSRTFGRWLENNLVFILGFDQELGWHLYDHIVDGILAGGEGASRSGLGEVYQGGEVLKQSRRTYDHAINGAIGMCAEALIRVAFDEIQEEDSLFSVGFQSRLERLFIATGEGGDHAVTICMSHLNWFMRIAPSWTKDCLIPMLDFEHPFSEPAWNGFIHSQNNPSQQLAIVLKPQFLNLYPWIESFLWGRDFSDRAAQWMSWMCVFANDKEYGLTQKEMRNTLRLMSGSARNKVIFWLGKVAQSNDDGWAKLVIPFIENVWPRERIFRTESSSLSWMGILDDSEDSFPTVYSAMKRFLVPVEGDSHYFHRFKYEVNGRGPITVRYPEVTLDFMDTVIPQSLRRIPYGLAEILALIAETKPELTVDPKYLRLIDLVERN